MSKLVLLSSTELPKSIVDIMLQQGVVDVLSAISLIERLKKMQSTNLLSLEQVQICEQVLAPYMAGYSTMPIPPKQSFGVLDQSKLSKCTKSSFTKDRFEKKLSLPDSNTTNNDKGECDE